MRLLGRWAALAALVIAWVTLSTSSLAQSSGPIPAGVGFDARFGGHVPGDIALVDDEGKAVRFGDYLDGERPVVLVLAYYECPMLCTMVLNGLMGALRQSGLEAGRDFQVVVVSFDPLDTPERARAKKATYVRYYGRSGGSSAFHFTTGTAGEVKRLADAVGIKYAYDPVSKQYAHPAGVTLLTGDGTISRYLYGVDFAPRDLRLGLVEAAKGKVGTAGDRLLLLCFHYDPALGRYSTAALASVRAGGIVTVAFLCISLLAMRKRLARPGPVSPGKGA